MSESKEQRAVWAVPQPGAVLGCQPSALCEFWGVPSRASLLSVQMSGFTGLLHVAPGTSGGTPHLRSPL